MPAFVGFRYGNNHRAVAALWARQLRQSDPEDLNLCLDGIEAWGRPVAELYRTEYTRGPRTHASWKSQDDVLVQNVDATVHGVFSSSSYRAIVGTSFAWPRVCVIIGYAFRADEYELLAGEVRDRYAKEAFSHLTVNDPLRSPDGVELLRLPATDTDEDSSLLSP